MSEVKRKGAGTWQGGAGLVSGARFRLQDRAAEATELARHVARRHGAGDGGASRGVWCRALPLCAGADTPPAPAAAPRPRPTPSGAPVGCRACGFCVAFFLRLYVSFQNGEKEWLANNVK